MRNTVSNPRLLAAELLLLFVLLPVSLVLDYSIYIKAVLILIGFVYIIIVLIKVHKIKFGIKKDLDWSRFWVETGFKLLGIAGVTIIYVSLIDLDSLFYVPLNHPWLFLLILFIYTFLSVWPQELIYRTFFVERYGRFFRSKKLLIFVNAILFSLAHLFFKNILVLVLTFLGGLFFAHTYLKFKSTTLVSIEHAVYGNWLFTVGMGQMLAFPGMDVQ